MKKILVFVLFLLVVLVGCVFNLPQKDETPYITSDPHFRPDGRFLIQLNNTGKERIKEELQEKGSELTKRRCFNKAWEWKSFPIYDEEGKRFQIIEYKCR